MSKFNKIIEELLLEHSQTYPFPSLDDKEQIKHLMECCDKLGYSEYKDIIREFFLNEDEPQSSPKSGESKNFPGKFHLGGGYYSSKENGPAEFKNDKGNLRPVTPEEKAKFDDKGMPAEKPVDKPTQKNTDSQKGKSPVKKVANVAKSAVDVAKTATDIATQHKEKIQQKIQNWSEEEKAFFKKGQDKAGSETRRSFAEALKDKVKGAGAAIKHGFQHEVHLFKTAAGAAHKWVKGEELTKEDKKAMIGVGIKVATTALTGAAFGGLHHGAVAFAKHVAMELAPHIVAETIAVGAIRASIFADVNADERVLMDFADKIADKFENMDISPEIMDGIIDKWNSEKPIEDDTQSKMESITLDELLESILLKEAEGESSQFPGKFHLGGGYYSSKEGGDVEFKNDNGNLRPVTAQEKEEFQSKGVGDSKQSEYIKTAEKELDKKEKEIDDENKPNPKEEPEKVLADPKASTKDRAMARAFKSEKDNLENKKRTDPEYQSKLKKEVIAKTAEISKELRGREDSDGNILDSETTENGSLLIGVEHGSNNESTQDAIQQIKSLPKDAKVVFLGEGGSEIDENGKYDFIDEQDEIRDAVMNHFDSPKEMSWDENSNIRDDNSPVFDDIATQLGGSREKAAASIWTNMIGQGDTDLAASDYLNDATKQWIKSEAKKGGSEEFNGEVDWDNLTLEQKEDLYELNYRDDKNYGETELFTGQKAYNDYRQKQLDRKIQEIEDSGAIAIASMGNSHVGNWRERNKPNKDTFNASSLRKLNKEMPDADSSIFNNQSDIDKIPDDKKKEISMKIDELADKSNKGEDFNLCQITVPGTNLYCDDNQGIPREEMPQFKGKPLPGTPAASMPKDSKGEVDTEPLFKKMLKEKGIKTIETELPSDKLKATQSELVGSKVAGMTKALEEDPNNPGITAPIYVSRDGYVIDGHHRWAAVTSNAIKAGKPANMKVIVVDMDIKDAIPMCNKFAEDQGIAAKKADANDGAKEEQPKPEKADETPNGIVYSVGGNYYSDTPNGPAQYIKTESVIQKVFIEENQNFINFLFETNVTKKTTDGKTLKLKVIEPKDQPEANKEAKNAKDGDSSTNSAPTPTSVGDAIFSTSKANGDDKKKAFVEKKKSELNKLLFSMVDDDNNLNLLSEPGGSPVSINAEDLTNVVDKIFSGESLDDEEKKLFNSCIKLVTNPTNGDVKVYISSKFVGRHPQQGYKSIEIAKNNISMGDAIRQYALENGLNVGKSSEGAIGKKVLNPVKMASSVNPDNPEAIVEIKKTANGVTIGGKEMKRLKELDYDGLVKSLTPKYGAEEAAKKAKLLVLQTKAYNQKLDDLAKIGEASDGKIPMANFGDVTTPENRKQTASNILDGCVKRFETELDNFGQQFGKEDLKNIPENTKVFNDLNKLKELNEKNNLETDENARAEYKATLDNLLINMANAPDFKDSVADFAEMKAGLQFLAEGKQVYFPSSENFQTADIIVMPDEFSIKPKDGQTTEEAIAENLQFYSVTVTYVGGLSVKYKGGGGSANYSKIEQTEYAHPETKQKLLDIQDIYTLAYPKDKTNQLNIQDSDIEVANKKLEDTIQWAIDSNLITKEEADLVRKIGQGQANNTLKGALKDVARCEGSNRDNFEKSIVLHHTMLHLTAVINNKDMAYTRFSNFNEEVSQNKDGQATKIKDDIADGVNKPCYMNPHHNPGFDVKEDGSGCMTGSPTNQNPSHIESEPPKNLLKAPK